MCGKKGQHLVRWAANADVQRAGGMGGVYETPRKHLVITSSRPHSVALHIVHAIFKGMT